MATITTRTELALENISLEPKIVLVIEGVGTVYATTSVKKIVRIGEDLVIGDFIIGGFTPLTNQSDTVSFQNSTTRITSDLSPDKGTATSVSSMRIEIIDKDDQGTELISPGIVVDDLLYKRAKIYVGFGDSTSFPEDYITVFRGVLDDINAGQGFISFNISSTEQRKRQDIFVKQDSEVTGTPQVDPNDDKISAVQTTIELTEGAQLIVKTAGPDNIVDNSFGTYVSIEDEIIQYTGKTDEGVGPNGGMLITGCIRGSLGTTAAEHSYGETVGSFYQLQGNAIELALKLMLSNVELIDTEYERIAYASADSTGVEFVDIDEAYPNSFIFTGFDVNLEHNIQVGDYVKSSGFTDLDNNLEIFYKILDIGLTSKGSYVTIDSSTLVPVAAETGTVEFTSQYNTLPDGLAMIHEEVDILAHKNLINRFLSSAEVRFEFDDVLEDTKEFIAKELYLPFASYEVPRDARSSVNYTIGPIPGDSVTQLDASNIINPSSLALKRSVSKNFYNTIIYKYEKQRFEDKFLRGNSITNSESLSRIKTGVKSLKIEALGMRNDLGAKAVSTQSISRYIARYKLGAEYFKGVKVSFSVGVQVEAGDIVLLDSTGLNIANTVTGTRGDKPVGYYEVTNKTIDLRTGEVSFDLLDTNFSTQARYGLISPSSYISKGVSESVFVIEPSFNTDKYGSAEYRKWSKYIGANIRVHNEDYSIDGNAVLSSVDSNQITLETDLGFIPTAGLLMEFGLYSAQTDQVKAVFAFHSDDSNNFPDGQVPYQQL